MNNPLVENLKKTYTDFMTAIQGRDYASASKLLSLPEGVEFTPDVFDQIAPMIESSYPTITNAKLLKSAENSEWATLAVQTRPEDTTESHVSMFFFHKENGVWKFHTDKTYHYDWPKSITENTETVLKNKEEFQLPQ